MKRNNQITPDNLPEGNWWDEEGAGYIAEKCNPVTFGCEWRWVARNLKAIEKGYNGQKLLPFILPEEWK